MKTFSVKEALIYLNEIMPDIAPQNEETLRRAIRKGTLQAKRKQGWEGNVISENDLLTYAREYAAKVTLQKQNRQIRLAAKSNIIQGQKNVLSLNANQFASFSESLPECVPIFTTADEILKKYLTDENPDKSWCRVALTEGLRQWQDEKNRAVSSLQALQKRISECDFEIKMFEQELEKY